MHATHRVTTQRPSNSDLRSFTACTWQWRTVLKTHQLTRKNISRVFRRSVTSWASTWATLAGTLMAIPGATSDRRSPESKKVLSPKQCPSATHWCQETVWSSYFWKPSHGVSILSKPWTMGSIWNSWSIGSKQRKSRQSVKYQRLTRHIRPSWRKQGTWWCFSSIISVRSLWLTWATSGMFWRSYPNRGKFSSRT